MRRDDRAARRLGGRDGGSGPAIGTARARGRNRLKPDLLVLEDRRLLATFTVTSPLDTTDGSGNPTQGTFRWAAEQADQAKSASTINFSLGTPATVTLDTLLKPVELSNTAYPVTITGPGAASLTIDANKEGAAILIDAGVTATITGLKVTDASLDLGSVNGAISNLGNLTISDCTLAGNTAISGLYDKGVATISDCTVTANDSYSGAGIYVTGQASITGCTIFNNVGKYNAIGAGICNKGTTTVTDCTISGNSGLGGGGGLYNSGMLTVTGCTISGNTGGGGGDVYNNKGGKAYLSGCTISNGSGFIDGGDVDDQYGGTLSLSDCVITGGTAETGGGVYNTGLVTIDQCTISGNTATGAAGGGYGGGVENGLLQKKAVVDITNSTLSGNTAEHSGGGLYNAGTASLANVTISGNFADQGGSLIASNGGGVSNTGTATLVACTIAGNTTTAHGGGVYNGGLGANAMTLNNTIVAGNTIARSGTASDIEVGGNTSGTFFVSGYNDLVGTGGDGGLGSSSGTNKVGIANPGLAPLGDYGGPTQTIALDSNSPAIGGGSKALELGPGGNALTADQRGFAFDTPNPDIGAFQSTSGSLVVKSTGEGSAIPFGELGLRSAVDLANLRTSKVTITFDSTAFATAQTIVLTAGPLELSNQDAAVTIKGPGVGVTVSGNLAGRVFQVDSGVTATISNLTITQGVAPGGTGANAGLGGGLLNLGNTTLTSCTISGNSATDGGGLANPSSATMTLSGTTVGGNTAKGLGGGLYNLGTAYLDNSTFSGNTAKTNGGGVYDRTGTVDLSGTTVSGNSATAGAGLFLDGPADLAASTISNNAPGGGVEVLISATLTDCTIVGNTAFGLMNQFGAVTMEACTVTGNDGTGLANYGNVSSPGTIAMTDTIVAGNALNGGSPTDIGGADPSDVTGSYNLIGTGGSGGLTNGSDGNMVGVANPLLASLGSYGGPTQTVAVLPGSPAIAAGTAVSGLTTDQRGETLDPSGPDIGAFQSQGFTLTPVAGSTPQSTGTGTAFTNLLAVTVAPNNPSEPVADGLITFNAPAGGASANLTGRTATVGVNGVASVGASANATNGSYVVTASTAGASAPASFDLSNLIGVTFASLVDPSITYGSSATFTGTLLSGGGQTPTGESVKVSVGGASGTGQINPDGSFSVTVNTSQLIASALTYTVSYSYNSDGTYASSSALGTLTVAQATPTVAVSDAGGTYSGSTFAATATVAGVVAGVDNTPSSSLEGVSPNLAYYSGTYTSPSQLSGVTPMAGAPTRAGSYTVLATFPGSTDYTTASTLANFTVAEATPTVAVSDAGGTYTGSAIAATATVAGLGGTAGASLETVSPTLSYYSGTYTDPSQLVGLTPLSGAPSQAGAYTVLASFAGSADYSPASAMADFTITQATPTISVNASGGQYGGSQPLTSATVAGVVGSAGTKLENVGLTFTYYSGTYTDPSQLVGLDPLSGAPSQAGNYTVEVTFPGSIDYTGASAVADFSIAQAAPVLAVSNPGGTFDGASTPTTDTVAGVVAGLDNTPGPQLEGVGLTLAYYSGTYTKASQLTNLTPLGGSPTGAGSYTVEVGFPGSTDYTAGTALANFTIATAAPTVAVTDAGGTYNLSTFPGTATVAGVVAGVDNTPSASLENVSPTLSYYSGTYTSPSQLKGLTPIAGGAPTDAGSYTVEASFPGSADYAPAASVANFTIAQATPTVAVTDAGGTYSGATFAATATVAGVNGTPGSKLENTAPTLSYYSGTYTSPSQLRGLTPLSGAPTHAGSYTVEASFPGTTDYAPAQTVANFSVAQAATQLTWSAPAGIVFGTPLSATQLDAIASVPGTPVYTPSYGAILGAGANQALSVTFTPTDSVDYTTVKTSTAINVAPATPSISVSAPGGLFDGSPYAASVSIRGSTGAAPAASLEDVSPALTYYSGQGTSGTDLGSTPPSAPGTYTVVVTFPGSADYTEVQSVPVTFTITQASPAISLALSSGTAAYGQAVTLTATLIGAPAGTVTFFDGGSPLGTAPVGASGQATFTTTALAVGDHAITASYSGAGGQLSATSLTATESVSKAAAQVVLTPQAVFKKKKVISLGLEAKVEPTTGGAAVPTGTVTFEVGKKVKKKVVEQVLGTVALSGGEATLAVKPNKVLKKAITVVYGGDAGFAADSVSVPSLSPASLRSLARPMLAIQHRGHRTR